MLGSPAFSCIEGAVVEGEKWFPVYASAYATQGGFTVRFEKNGGSASNVEVSMKYFISEA
ncbi:hypothetical protein C7J99_09405 [Brevibacillus brevis]|nr:hypothetical protein C7J99_09405 [Brevibacillus brevis]